MRSGFISKCMYARLQVSVQRGYNSLCLPGLPKIGFLHFDPCDLEMQVKPEFNLPVSAYMSGAHTSLQGKYTYKYFLQ